MFMQVEKRNIFIITTIYFLAHGLLLIVSGRWWDDWCAYKMSSDELWAWSLEMGRPSVFLILKFTQFLPDSAYIYFVFALYLISSIIYYIIIKKIFKLSEKSCLYITLLNITTMAYSARILLVCFPYCIGYTLFLVAFWQLIYIHESKKENAVVLCAINILLFFISFILNANLVLYVLVIIFIISRVGLKKTLFSSTNLYYILNPLIYFIGKSLLFPAHGAYLGYNAITSAKIKFALTHIWQIYITNITNLIMVYIKSNFIKITIIFVVLMLIFDNRYKIVDLIRNRLKSYAVIAEHRQKDDSNGGEIQESIKLFVIGSITLMSPSYLMQLLGQEFQYIQMGLPVEMQCLFH